MAGSRPSFDQDSPLRALVGPERANENAGTPPTHDRDASERPGDRVRRARVGRVPSTVTRAARCLPVLYIVSISVVAPRNQLHAIEELLVVLKSAFPRAVAREDSGVVYVSTVV